MVTSSRRWVLMHELRGAAEPTFEEQVKHLSPCDLLLVEGFKHAPIPKLEVWRAEPGEPFLHPNDAHIVAIATDAKVEAKLPVLDLNDPDGVAAFIVKHQGLAMNKGLLSVDDALRQLLAGAMPITEAEEVSTLEATGRVLARDQTSTMDVPPMDNSAMDGYAVRLVDLAGDAPKLRVAQRIPAGSVGRPLEAGTAARIFTGAPIPEGCDAIVMQEFCEAQGDHVVLKKRPQPSEWIRRTGSDIRKGGIVLAAGKKLLPQDTGLAASVGIKALPVLRKLRLGLFFTGDELVMPGDPARPGPDLQLQPLHAQRPRAGLRLRGARLRHRPGQPRGHARRAAPRRGGERRHRYLGRRVGRRRGPCKARRRGGGVAAHVAHRHEAGAAARVRHRARRGTFGSVHRAAGQSGLEFRHLLIFVRPFLRKTQGIAGVEPRVLEARADFDWLEPDARREFLRAKWNGQGGLDLYPTQDSAVMTSTAWADGLIDNPAGLAIRKGDRVRFLPYSELYG